MKSNYGLYIEEREGIDILEDGKGFATFKHITERKELYISDVFIRKEYRKENRAAGYFDELTEMAKELECEYLLTHVDPETNGWELSQRALTGYGFRETVTVDSLVFFRKDL